MQKASFLTFCVIFLLYTHNEEERTADAVRSSFAYAGFINTLKRLAFSLKAEEIPLNALSLSKNVFSDRLKHASVRLLSHRP